MGTWTSKCLGLLPAWLRPETYSYTPRVANDKTGCLHITKPRPFHPSHQKHIAFWLRVNNKWHNITVYKHTNHPHTSNSLKQVLLKYIISTSPCSCSGRPEGGGGGRGLLLYLGMVGRLTPILGFFEANGSLIYASSQSDWPTFLQKKSVCFYHI